jgi:hypothetical protein
MKNGQVQPARGNENEKEGEETKHEIHRFGFPKKREQIIEHNRNDQDLYDRSDRTKKVEHLKPHFGPNLFILSIKALASKDKMIR